MEAEPYHHKLLIEVIEHFSAAQPAAPIHLQLQKSSQTVSFNTMLGCKETGT
jgi:hypothetical protein